MMINAGIILKEGAQKSKQELAPKNIDINLMSYQYFEGVDLLGNRRSKPFNST